MQRQCAKYPADQRTAMGQYPVWRQRIDAGYFGGTGRLSVAAVAGPFSQRVYPLFGFPDIIRLRYNYFSLPVLEVLPFAAAFGGGKTRGDRKKTTRWS